ncbi:MAG: HDOD domain-containing protein [Gammaproteobacteria bacterium]|nr:HDOD domain-containing protein [Rhodocyclaceae bacterium]MBU3908030.1 HDOD domain-containing protein [Gammaproteobacteria bacterium]MBU3990588.1 HDOD domain-containing protein [Gammaproteobacteria bacterium]MBU4006039.1 HDOD domain-containing protein [Gammaproteobacteria bacterium]MBU4022040.1 HDOD domain-containing protein [Gammaproteobacteria bacterium]
MNSPDNFPLITLQPVSDAGHFWVALMLEADVPLDSTMLAHVLGDDALAEALDDAVSCIAAVDPARVDPAQVGTLLPPGRLILRIPVAAAADPGQHATLATLQEAGLVLMATGFPEPGATLFPGVTSLAVTCPGRAVPAGFADWLRKLPGPHLALGPTEDLCPGFCKFHWRAEHDEAQLAAATKGDTTSRNLLLKLLILVTSDADSAEIGDLIKHDPNLAYHLLKLVNSPAFAPDSRITSFAHAIVLMGRRQLQRWVQLLLYARPPGSTVASPLLPRAALRASLMEALAKCAQLSREQQDLAFMTGMFSLLEALFGVPIAEIIAPLNLDKGVVQALTAGEGGFGEFLATVVASEGPPSPELAARLLGLGIAHEDWAVALAEAARWAVLVSREA